VLKKAAATIIGMFAIASMLMVFDSVRQFGASILASAGIAGIVFLHVDSGVPVDALRAELTRLLKASPHWDGKVNVLQVTDAKEHTLELRALASAADASLAWDLRCEIREKLVAFIQQTYPESLPRFRASLDAPSA
jgi:hypothetical protein